MQPPKRIVSLVPSQTELLSHLGLDKEIVGITKFCIHPDEIFKNRTRVGGTKNVDLDKVRDLSPDLIIANKEENNKEQVEALSKEFPVYVSDVSDLNTALEMIGKVGELCNRASEAEKLREEIETGFNALIPVKTPKSTLYLIWKDPYMSVGQDTFIHDMLSRCGLRNIYAGSTRYPEVDMGAIEAPELVLLSSEPFPFKETHIQELKVQWPQAEFRLVDGEYFSWYGSRLLGSLAYFKSLDLH